MTSTWVRETPMGRASASCRGCNGPCCRRGVRRVRQGRDGRRHLLAGDEGEAIGRWGPVGTYGGRTEGEPCPTGIADMCGDTDVSAWLYAAKTWLQKAKWLREMTAVAYGPDKAKWPDIAKIADAGLEGAQTQISGDLGFLDGEKVANLAKIQRALKYVCEAFAVAVDDEGTVQIPPNIYNPIDDPNNVPPVIPWPNPFDFLGKLGAVIPVAVGLGLALLLTRSGK